MLLLFVWVSFHLVSRFSTAQAMTSWDEVLPRRSVGPSPASVSALIRARPVSWPTGRAPARHSLMPLYWAGLWEAVNMAPGASSLPAAK